MKFNLLLISMCVLISGSISAKNPIEGKWSSGCIPLSESTSMVEIFEFSGIKPGETVDYIEREISYKDTKCEEVESEWKSNGKYKLGKVKNEIYPIDLIYETGTLYTSIKRASEDEIWFANMTDEKDGSTEDKRSDDMSLYFPFKKM